MYFDLTDSLADSIIFSMEDQTGVKLVDAETGTVVDSEDTITADNDRYYSIPEWTSSEGYSLLEEFVHSLHTPMAREDLQRVLIGGRGVFRNFKNVLKSYPEVERKWHYFKNMKMKARLMEWYNDLRESWGLEKLEESEINDTDELVENDFMFRQYDFEKDRSDIEQGIEIIAEEYALQFAGDLGSAVADLWLYQSSYSDFADKTGFVCHSTSEDFTGCILFSSSRSSSKKTVVATDFFVLQNFRGLGIGQELLNKSLSFLKDNGVRWVIFSNTIIPKTMEPLLSRLGFEKLGSGFVADLFKEM